MNKTFRNGQIFVRLLQNHEKIWPPIYIVQCINDIGDNRHSCVMSHGVALKKSSFYRLCLMSFWHPVKGSLGTKKAAFGQTIRFYCLGIKQKRKVVGRGNLGILDGHFQKFRKCRKIQKKVLLAQKAAPKKA